MSDEVVASNDDRKALARCCECFDDGQHTDVGQPAIDRLVALGWLVPVKRRLWDFTREGIAVLHEDAANV